MYIHHIRSKGCHYFAQVGVTEKRKNVYGVKRCAIAISERIFELSSSYLDDI